MIESILLLSAVIGLIGALIPLRQLPYKVIGSVAMTIMLTIGVSYWVLGGWQAHHAYFLARLQHEKTQAVLALTRDPETIIHRLKARVLAEPQRAKGWYLLGRLYASQNQWVAATNAFNEAHRLRPEDVQITVNLAQSFIASGHPDGRIKGRTLLLEVLSHHPMQKDALAMIAIDAYTHQDYPHAIEAWQRLLTQLPADSEEALFIRKAIAKAYHHLSTDPNEKVEKRRKN